MPLRLPSLSNKGVVIIILKLAIGLIVLRALLFGVMYSSEGLIITALAKTTEGGKAKVDQRVLSTRAVAKVVRSVVIAGAGISPPSNADLVRARSILAP